ncbi:MAG: peptide deformylase [Bacilli bacterium]|nr:peptide deformylase [Bacilli bacterium]MDD4282744.1 peptide deformylase [Bacilli bacterium]MDD4718871.1 peptide deformylase [Bacilli bacterium]
MLKKLKILDESDKRLRKVSDNVTFPLSIEHKELIKKIIKQLKYSQIEEKQEKYNLRPGMGLAFPQLGIHKRIIVIVEEVEENKFNNHVVINPEIISHSVEMIAAEAGEGCLSVNREVEGHVRRYARVTIKGFDEDGNKIKIRAREELAIAFQHEIDHLNGILFYDHIDKKKPILNEIEIRFI